MATREETQRRPAGGRLALTLVQVAVIAPTVAYLVAELSSQTKPIPWGEFIFWVAVVATVELLPVPAWRGLRISLVFPVIIAVAVTYDPCVAASVRLGGFFELRDCVR